MAQRFALIVGAGFSKPANGPLMKELLSEEVVSASRADKRILAALSSMLSERQSIVGPSYDMEELFTQVWREARTGANTPIRSKKWRADKLLDEMLVHLASICWNIKFSPRSRIGEAYKAFLEDLFLKNDSFDVLSFNYDTLVERCLDAAEVQFGYGATKDIEFHGERRRRSIGQLKPEMHIFKLHGSSNWGVCRGCPKAEQGRDVITAFEEPYITSRKRSCPFCGRGGLESGIVPPVHGKAGEARHIQAIWREARERLRRAEHILIVGYSLPRSDYEAASLLREIRPESQVSIIAGPAGIPKTYADVLPYAKDESCYIEDYLAGKGFLTR